LLFYSLNKLITVRSRGYVFTEKRNEKNLKKYSIFPFTDGYDDTQMRLRQGPQEIR
jgi:hypothetical protein